MPAFIDPHGHLMNASQIFKWAKVSRPAVGLITMIADFNAVLQKHVKKQG